MLPQRYANVGYGIATMGSVERYIGLAALAMERWDDAIAHLERALDHNEKIDLVPYEAHTRHDLGRALLLRGENGDRTRARTLLRQSGAIAERLGMTWLADRGRETEALGGF